MRVLLSTIGSRGDVQPLAALGLQLQRMGHEAHLCAPPDFRAWIEGLGLSLTPIGPEVRNAGAVGAAAPSAPPSPEQMRQAMQAMVANQFETVTVAAKGCDAIVAATALQIATRSVAELMGIPYVFTAYCPTVLPSVHHAPPPLTSLGQAPAPPGADHAELWRQDAERFHRTFGDALNTQRAAAGLAPVGDAQSHVFADRPWLACDATLAPWPDPDDGAVLQTGAWILRDRRPLSPELEAFLDAGEPPVYFGFGSMHAPEELGGAMVEAARALGRRAIVSRGWANLRADVGPDCLAIEEANLQALFRRVSAVLHHGGAGTTTTATAAGAPQVVVPHLYDQYYFAERIQELAIGVAHAARTPSSESLAGALERVLHPEVADRARSVASRVSWDGAEVAARRLVP